MEVTAALSSSDTKIVLNMKETMHKFQAFLADFEVILISLYIDTRESERLVQVVCSC